tara:strand:+ start:1122 stop:1349 length:228 start_codon:yes stop_codon:yes gene_type:complete
MVDNERPNDSMCDCDCKCHDNGIGKTGSTTRILGSAHNSIDLYVSTPAKTKWIFVDDMEQEITHNLRKANKELCG